ncbi:MAG: NUDIX domain-containing protein [Nanoarchaeota archaeon]
MTDEKVAVLDKNGVPSGEEKLKSAVHKEGLFHWSVHLWIYNTKEEILLQKRASTKNLFPGLWDMAAAGHVAAKESIEDALDRELFEELGLKIERDKIKKIEVRKTGNVVPGWQHPHNEFVHVYLLRWDGNANELTIQKSEVEKVTFIPLNKFEAELKDPKKSKKYVPHNQYYFDIIKEIKNDLLQNHP